MSRIGKVGNGEMFIFKPNCETPEWLIRHNSSLTSGLIPIGQVETPKDLIGKKVIIKVEVVGEVKE